MVTSCPPTISYTVGITNSRDSTCLLTIETLILHDRLVPDVNKLLGRGKGKFSFIVGLRETCKRA